jgi:hypothetical protein
MDRYLDPVDAPAEHPEPSYRYDAFISYRHVEPDRTWAKWLHRALETWRTPKPLVARGVRARFAPVFRDEDDLAASPHLSADIRQALRDSRYLIVVCSPRARDSQWIDAEVKQFRELGRGDRILALLVEGEPSEALPRALYEIRGDALIGGTDEPLAADVRPTADSSTGSRRRLGRLKILAPLLGCRLDDLRQREQERQRRRMVVAGAVLLAIVAVLAGSTAYSIQQKEWLTNVPSRRSASGTPRRRRWRRRAGPWTRSCASPTSRPSATS